jgi:ABC-type transport system involved in cytochrome c biogenesis permease subunit
VAERIAIRMNNLWGFGALCLYAISLALYVWHLNGNDRRIGYFASLELAAALILHYLALLQRSHLAHAVPYDDLYGSMSLFAWLLAFTYLALETFHRQRSVGAFVLPVVIVWLVAAMLYAPGAAPPPAPARGALFALHVTLNIMAYAAFALSFVLSLIYLLQNRMLRARKPSRVFWRFPPLDVLDRMSRSSVAVGVAALVVGAAFGLVWEHRLRGSYGSSDPKVLVTLLIILVYGAYLWLARAIRWRGARAALLCAWNFVLVVFSYSIVNLYLTRFHRFY